MKSLTEAFKDHYKFQALKDIETFFSGVSDPADALKFIKDLVKIIEMSIENKTRFVSANNRNNEFWKSLTKGIKSPLVSLTDELDSFEINYR